MIEIGPNLQDAIHDLVTGICFIVSILGFFWVMTKD